MSQMEYEAAIAEYLRTKGVTRCPTVCAAATQATIDPADRAAYRDYVATREARRLARTRLVRPLIEPWTSTTG
jgi:hypothetical protein